MGNGQKADQSRECTNCKLKKTLLRYFGVKFEEVGQVYMKCMYVCMSPLLYIGFLQLLTPPQFFPWGSLINSVPLKALIGLSFRTSQGATKMPTPCILINIFICRQEFKFIHAAAWIPAISPFRVDFTVGCQNLPLAPPLWDQTLGASVCQRCSSALAPTSGMFHSVGQDSATPHQLAWNVSNASGPSEQMWITFG